MLFNSLEFLIFFPIVTITYFLLPHKYRWFLLLISSCIFYMAAIPEYILILFIAIIIDYLMAILIEKYNNKMKFFLVIAVLSTCLLLFLFKYYNFVNENIEYIASILGIKYSVSTLNLILPIGLSFHTFQSLSYVVEVYKGRQKAERNFGMYALYVMFYPQLMAGPIERPQNLLPQLYEKHYFDYARVTGGLKLMAWGLFKKIVIADRLAIVVSHVYSNLYDFNGVQLLIPVLLFPIELYCDFSGYSDIAIGSAQVMGIKMMDNFNRPFSSRSISEFFNRWHISLNSWLIRYIYLPITPKDSSNLRIQCSIVFIWLISGLWHGAGWNYILWGGSLGFFVVFSMWTKKIRNYIIYYFKININSIWYKYFQRIVVYLLISFSTIFFSTKTISDGWYIITHLFYDWDVIWNLSVLKDEIIKVFTDGKFQLIITIGPILFLLFIHHVQKHEEMRNMFSKKPFWYRWGMYFILVFGMLFLGVFSGDTKFVYFQF